MGLKQFSEIGLSLAYFNLIKNLPLSYTNYSATRLNIFIVMNAITTSSFWFRILCFNFKIPRSGFVLDGLTSKTSKILRKLSSG